MKTKLISKNNKQKKEDIAFGIWSDKKENVDKMVRKLRKERNFDI